MPNKEIMKNTAQTKNELDIIDIISQVIKNSGRDETKIKYTNIQAYCTMTFYNLAYIRVKWGSKSKYIAIPGHLNYMLKLVNLQELTAGSDTWIRIPIETETEIVSLSTLLLEIFDYCHSKIEGETFGCCSKYLECSDTKSCVQEHEQWSKGCSYRNKLISGKIFYGKNSTILKKI